MRAIIPAVRANSLSNHWFNEFDQMFETLFDQNIKNQMSLACDVDESDQYILFSFDLPGLTEDDFKIEINENTLEVSGERKVETASQNVRSFRGRHYGAFKHRFQLPKLVDRDKIEADYTNGVLKILLPKHEQEKPKKIEVKTKKGNFLNQLLKSKESA